MKQLHRLDSELYNGIKMDGLFLGGWKSDVLVPGQWRGLEGHVPKPRTKVARYYGLYNRCKEADLAKRMESFNQDLPEEIEFLDWQSYCDSRGDEHPEMWPICGKRLVYLSEIPCRRSIFPPTGAVLKEAA